MSKAKSEMRLIGDVPLMTDDERHDLIHKIAESRTLSQRHSDLRRFYYNDQMDWLDSLSDEALIEESMI